MKTSKHAFLAVIAAAFTCLTFTNGALCARADDNPYSVEYTVNGYVGTEALTNFPVLVRLSAGSPLGFAYADCAEEGADLTFTDDGGNVIPREIDTWNTAGESLVWVCVPVVTNGASFTMHYGDTYVAAQPTCQTDGSVWSNANYNAVWHFASSNKESVHDLSATVSGTTAYKNDGTYPTVMGGNALWLSNNGYLRYANSADWTTLGDGNTLTLSCWAISQNPGYGRMISCKANWNDAIGYELTTQNSDTTITIGTLGESQQQFSGVPSVKSWRHITATYSSNGTLSLWVDGLSKGSASKSALTTPTAALTLGANSGTGNYWPGGLDEVRIHRGVESGDWIKACYDTMTSASFLTAGPRISGAAPILANATATPGYTDAQLSIRLSSVGDGATSATVTFAWGLEDGELSESVVLAAAATDGQVLTTNLAGLANGTSYRYSFTAVNDLTSPMSQTVEGTFSTRAYSAPTLSLSNHQEGAESQTVGVSVTELGGGSSCDLYFAYGPNDGTSLAYTQVATGLAVGETFSRLLEGLDVGTVYAYSFAATNDLGLGTVETGTFTAGVGCLNPAHFAYRATFTVIGYTGTEVLENFPALVRLAADSPLAFDYADCAAGGSDIRFADAEGRLIPHEIETWDTAGESLIWVGLPIATNGTAFTMYYHSDAPGVSSADDVWTNYVAVVHGSALITNSVAGGPAATAGSAAVTASANAGKIGGGVNKSSNNSIGLNIATPSAKLTDTGKFSVSAWFKRNGNGGGGNGTHILGASRPGWNSGAGYLWLQEQGTYIDIAAPNSHQFSTGNYTLPDGVWAHVAFSYDSGASLTTYFNGAQDNQKTSGVGNLVSTAATWTFGSYQNTASADSFMGDMDELRIYNGVASGDRIKAEYDTMASGDFLTAGPSSAGGAPILSTSTLLVDVDAVDVSATVDVLGGDATSCDLYFAYAPAGDALPAWTLVASGLAADASHTRHLTGLVEDADYDYAFLVSNNLGRTTIKSGAFMTSIGFKRPDPAVAEFSRGVKFTVTGYTGTQELTNFPVLVRLSNNSPSGFSYADFYNPGDVAGADLCFLDADGNGIPHEIDTWNTAGESLVWVTIPRMTNGVEFSMWYRSSKNGSVVCHANAWEDYTGVWHLGEGGDGVQTVADSTVNALDGVTHANSSAQSAGRIGGSRRVSTKGGASDANGRILVSLSDANKRAAVDALAETGSDKTFTASAWMRPRGGTDYCYLIGRKTDDKYGAWGVQFNANSSSWYNSMRVYSAGTADSQSASVGVDATANGVWRKIDVVWTKTTYTVYYDGGAKKWTGALNSSNGQEPLNGSSDLAFGGTTSSGYGSMNGELDEVRLRRGDMGADWVKADYDTVNNTAFLNGGTVVSLAETPRPIATLALSDSSAKYVQFSGSIGNCGGEATECAAYCKVWKTAEDEPSTWTLLVSGLGAGDVFTKAVTGLDPETAYSYKIKAVNNLETPVDSEIEEGTFTTGGTGSGGTGGERYRVGNDYVHVFEIEPGTDVTSFEFTPPDYVSSIQALVVAGGGPGGYRRGGGGGAGGLVYDDALAVTGGAVYAINVGTGGVASASAAAYGSNGGGSSIVGTGVSVTAVGGGAGGNGPSNAAGMAGGSGGGSGSGSTTAGAGTAGQGNAGGIRGVNSNNSTGGGGGGAGRAGSDGSLDNPPAGGSGGQGFRTDISGTPTWYAGGGGGGGMQAGSASNLGSPGGGGDGGGGTGGMAVPSGTANPSFGPAAAAGQNGLGGGGGGGSDVSGFYEGGNGGNGIVIVRYTVEGTGAGSAEPVVSLTGATYAGDLKITGTYRVAWAGEGANDADVYIKWGYAVNSLTHSVLVAPDAIGTGTFEITVPVDQTTIYLRAMADNGTAQGLSDEIVPIYIPEYSGVVPGDPTIPVLGTVSLAADGVFARVSGTVTSFGTAGAGEDPITGCEVYALVGTSANVSRMNAQDAMPVTAGEPFSLAISNLTANVTYYWCLEARNSAGVAVATEVGSFTTLGASSASSVTTSANQRNVSVSGSLSQVGAGTTTILARWNDGGWSAWEPVATFAPGAASTAFTATHLASGWSNVGWEIMCSNECATAEGVPTGQAWTSTLSGTVSPEDKAVYTWQPVDGDWNGAWNDSAHWSCSFEDGRGYPQMGTATASFANCTLANPVTVSVPTAHTIGTLRFFGENPVSLTFVGQGASTSRITATTLQENAAKSDSVLEFRDMTVGRVNDNFWTVAPTDSSTTNLTLRFSGTTLQNVSSFVFAAPYSTVEFLNGSTATFSSKMSIGGTNTVVTIDDSVVNAKSIYIPADADGPGMKVRLCGTTPLLKQNTTDGAFTCWAQSWPMVYEFQVPVGGYTAAPIQMVSTSYKFGQANTSDTSGATPTLSFSVANDSPAMRTSGTILNNVLVQTASGFQIDRMANPIGTVLRNGTIKYGLNGAETSDTDAARQILLDLTGRSPLTMILVW